MSESSLYLDNERYAELARLEATVAALGPSTDADLSSRCAAFLYFEARVLDDRRWDEWSELLADDVVYWIPISADGGDPRTETTITLDDRRRALDRVEWLKTGKVRADLPFRTRRSLANVEAWKLSAERFLVLSNFTLHEYRRQHMVYAGRYVHELVTSHQGWRIRTKQALLVNADEALDNIIFIF